MSTSRLNYGESEGGLGEREGSKIDRLSRDFRDKGFEKLLIEKRISLASRGSSGSPLWKHPRKGLFGFLRLLRAGGILLRQKPQSTQTVETFW